MCLIRVRAKHCRKVDLASQIWLSLLWCKAVFSVSLLLSSVSHDPSEIILICWFAAHMSFLSHLINVMQSCWIKVLISFKKIFACNVYYYCYGWIESLSGCVLRAPMTQLPADTADYPTTCSMFDIIVQSLRRTHDSSSDQLDQNLFFISFFFLSQIKLWDMLVPCLLHTVYSISVDVGEKSYHHIIDI